VSPGSAPLHSRMEQVAEQPCNGRESRENRSLESKHAERIVPANLQVEESETANRKDPSQKIESSVKPDFSVVYATRIEFLRTTSHARIGAVDANPEWTLPRTREKIRS
jgi:hypothetical protein